MQDTILATMTMAARIAEPSEGGFLLSMKAKNPAAVALGRLGGKAGIGQAKARDPAKMRAAALKRWSKRTQP